MGIVNKSNVIKKVPMNYQMDLSVPDDIVPTSLRIPKTLRFAHGCVNCEWRDYGLCPHNFLRGRGHSEKDNTHANGICGKRINYLLGFLPMEILESKKRISYPMWKSYFNEGLGQIEHLESKGKLDSLRLDLKDMTSKLESLRNDSGSSKDEISEKQKEITRLEKKVTKAREEWFQIWDRVSKTDERRADREHVKKVEMDVRKTMSLTDMHSVMRGDVQEAEYKEEDE